MGKLPPINKRAFDNTKTASACAPPPCGEVGSRSDPGGGPLQRARHLRANATLPEQILWLSLRTFKDQGFHFRRQAPIGRYIADFVCHSAKLVIEIDGTQHAERDAVAYDEARTAFLRSRGYRVLRFWNDAVLYDRSSVVDIIASHLTQPPTRFRSAKPTSPQGGGAPKG